MGCCGGGKSKPLNKLAVAKPLPPPKPVFVQRLAIPSKQTAQPIVPVKAQKIVRDMKCKCGYPLTTTYISNKQRHICSNPNCETRLNVK